MESSRENIIDRHDLSPYSYLKSLAAEHNGLSFKATPKLFIFHSRTHQIQSDPDKVKVKPAKTLFENINLKPLYIEHVVSFYRCVTTEMSLLTKENHLVLSCQTRKEMEWSIIISSLYALLTASSDRELVYERIGERFAKYKLRICPSHMYMLHAVKALRKFQRIGLIDYKTFNLRLYHELMRPNHLRTIWLVAGKVLYVDCTYTEKNKDSVDGSYISYLSQHKMKAAVICLSDERKKQRMEEAGLQVYAVPDLTEVLEKETPALKTFLQDFVRHPVAIEHNPGSPTTVLLHLCIMFHTGISASLSEKYACMMLNKSPTLMQSHQVRRLEKWLFDENLSKEKVYLQPLLPQSMTYSEEKKFFPVLKKSIKGQ